MSNTCGQCKLTFDNSSLLKKHVYRNLQCRKFYHKPIVKCSHCDKEFCYRSALKRHMLKCKNAKGMLRDDKTGELFTLYTKTINELHSKILVQNEQLKNIKEIMIDQKLKIHNLQKEVSKPRIQYVYNLFNISNSHIIDSVKNLTLNHVKRGSKGYAEYALDYPFKDRLVCRDKSRLIFNWKNDKGEVVNDSKLQKLAPVFFQSLKMKSINMINDLISDKRSHAMTPEEGVINGITIMKNVINCSNGKLNCRFMRTLLTILSEKTYIKNN